VSKLRVLVTGGAGYVGSAVVEDLIETAAERIVVLDDLSTGHEAAVRPPALLVRGDIADKKLVTELCVDERIDAVVHLAGSSLVGESTERPEKYYANNVVKGIAFVDAVLAGGVRRFVFSSSAAVYGEPTSCPISEDFQTVPTSAYGETKLAMERVLKWYQRAHGMNSYSLRYFNAAGATANNGEQHSPETHLIPMVLSVACGAQKSVTIFGHDYPTQDGTCLRDYIHVSDLAHAHVLALEALRTRSGGVLNLGNGTGFSVAEVIDVARRVTGRPIQVEHGPRREGDPSVLVASAHRAMSELGWRPNRPQLECIVEDAWKWLLAHPRGYVSSSPKGEPNE
jgi:UDP-glucose 4-epimerase